MKLKTLGFKTLTSSGRSLLGHEAEDFKIQEKSRFKTKHWMYAPSGHQKREDFEVQDDQNLRRRCLQDGGYSDVKLKISDISRHIKIFKTSLIE